MLLKIVLVLTLAMMVATGTMLVAAKRADQAKAAEVETRARIAAEEEAAAAERRADEADPRRVAMRRYKQAQSEARREQERLAGPPPTLEQACLAATAMMRISMFDPESARYRWPDGLELSSVRRAGTTRLEDERLPAWELSFDVNGKNRLGGYVGAKSYRLYFRNGQVIGAREPEQVEAVEFSSHISMNNLAQIPQWSTGAPR